MRKIEKEIANKIKEAIVTGSINGKRQVRLTKRDLVGIDSLGQPYYQLWDTKIAQFEVDEDPDSTSVKVRVRSGGHKTNTTKSRLNAIGCYLTNNTFGVHQENFNWYITLRDSNTGAITRKDFDEVHTVEFSI